MTLRTLLCMALYCIAAACVEAQAPSPVSVQAFMGVLNSNTTATRTALSGSAGTPRIRERGW
jgi:hypothetical protein